MFNICRGIDFCSWALLTHLYDFPREAHQLVRPDSAGPGTNYLIRFPGTCDLITNNFGQLFTSAQGYSTQSSWNYHYGLYPKYNCILIVYVCVNLLWTAFSTLPVYMRLNLHDNFAYFRHDHHYYQNMDNRNRPWYGLPCQRKFLQSKHIYKHIIKHISKGDIKLPAMPYWSMP